MRNWPEGFLIRAAQAFLNDLSFSSSDITFLFHYYFQLLLLQSYSSNTTAVISLLMTACQEDFTTTVVQTAKVWTYQQSEFRKQLRKVLNVWKILFIY